MKKRILCSHPHTMARRELKIISSETFFIDDMDEAATTEQMMFRLRSKHYTHLIVGFAREDMSVSEAMETICTLFPGLRILFLSDKNLPDIDLKLAGWKIFYHFPMNATELYLLKELNRFFHDDMPARGNEDCTST